MRYNPDGKYKTTLWVRGDGIWYVGDHEPSIHRGPWEQVRVEISDFVTDEDLGDEFDDLIRRAPRIGGLINFQDWRWWQACQREEEE